MIYLKPKTLLKNILKVFKGKKLNLLSKIMSIK